MKNQKGNASPILTSGDIRRIQADIAEDIKIREEASERISTNKALLDAHDEAVAARLRPSAKPARKTRKPIIPPRAPVVKPRMPATWAATETPAVAPQPAPQKFERGGGSYSVVMDILQRARDGLAAAELRRKASEHPQASDSLKNHPSYIYSILEQLKVRSEVVKGDDGKWRARSAASTTH